MLKLKIWIEYGLKMNDEKSKVKTKKKNKKNPLQIHNKLEHHSHDQSCPSVQHDWTIEIITSQQRIV